MWDLVQIEMERRDNLGAKYSSSDIFSSKLICGDCGGFYGKKWHSNTKYERSIYQCNNKFDKNKDIKTTEIYNHAVIRDENEGELIMSKLILEGDGDINE